MGYIMFKSFALNTKMIDPLWVCQEVERAHHERDEVSINAAEGFYVKF